MFFDVREVVRTSSKLFNNAWDWLEILWKSLPALFWSHWKSVYTFCYRWKSSENLWKSLETFGDLRKSFEIFGNLQKPSVNLRKFRFCGDEKSHSFYWKKVGRYSVHIFPIHWKLVESSSFVYWIIHVVLRLMKVMEPLKNKQKRGKSICDIIIHTKWMEFVSTRVHFKITWKNI